MYGRYQMPRYFFNLIGNKCSLLDKDGIELDDVVAVREYAHKRAAELAEEVHKIINLSDWRIQICDENGDNILSMPCEPDTGN
jgi:hypothetical protein